jgi:hypothetical protein
MKTKTKVMDKEYVYDQLKKAGIYEDLKKAGLLKPNHLKTTTGIKCISLDSFNPNIFRVTIYKKISESRYALIRTGKYINITEAAADVYFVNEKLNDPSTSWKEFYLWFSQEYPNGTIHCYDKNYTKKNDKEQKAENQISMMDEFKVKFDSNEHKFHNAQDTVLYCIENLLSIDDIFAVQAKILQAIKNRINKEKSDTKSTVSEYQKLMDENKQLKGQVEVFKEAIRNAATFIMDEKKEA